MQKTTAIVLASLLATSLAPAAQDASQPGLRAGGAAEQLAPPVRLEADGAPIDIGALSKIAHAGPWVADVDCDGDRDLLIGDFPGYFWFFENTGTDGTKQFTSRGQLQAGEKAAKTPVY